MSNESSNGGSSKGGRIPRVGEVLGLLGLNGPTVRAVKPPVEPEVCPRCKGAHWFVYDVPYGHAAFGRAFPCDCLITQQSERELTDLRRLSNLEPFREWTFETFDPRVPGVQRAHQKSRQFSSDPRGWLVLLGGVGCGKTHLAAAIANEQLENESKVLFTVVPELLDHLRSTFSPQSQVRYDELFEAVRTTPLLVLDDLGTEASSPWAGEKLYQLFNHRYNYQMPTVVTSNRRLEQLDERIASRMSDRALSEIVEIDAPDYRPRQRGERKQPPRRAR
ncbi:MAG: ATP-binding protein [Chloroflexi bacterium]|nr:ATP-binding protein [Chloroflexota bacterium]